MAVLIGMVPVTIDVTVRVVGQATVFIFSPAVGLIGIAVKIFAVCPVLVEIARKMKIVLYETVYMNWFGGIFSPATVLGKHDSGSKVALRKYYAINRITMSTIVIAELAITYALITTAPSDSSSDSFSRKMISRGNLRLPAEVREDLNCANICPAEQVFEGNMAFLAEKVEDFVKTNNLTNLTNSTDMATLLNSMKNKTKSEESTNKEKACRDYVPMPSKEFHILTITLMFLAAYTIIESIAMLIGIHATPSDWLLFDQKDRSDKVF